MISERTAFQLVAAMAILVALVVAPAAARTISTTGATVYVGEEDIAFAGAFGAGPVTQIVHYSDLTTGAIDKTIQANAAGNITELARTAIGTTTGPYYVFDAAGDPTNRATALGYIIVQNPQATLGVVLSVNTLESIDGKSVTRSTPVAFKLTNNLNGLAGAGAAMNIEVILPGGGVTTQFGNQILSGIAVNGTTALANPVDLSNVEAGTYTAVAKWPSGSDFYGKGFDSNAVTFEVLIHIACHYVQQGQRRPRQQFHRDDHRRVGPDLPAVHQAGHNPWQHRVSVYCSRPERRGRWCR